MGNDDGRSSQLDLFGWRRREGDPAGPGEDDGRPPGPGRRTPIDSDEISAMTAAALLDALDAGLETATTGPLLLLIAEVGRRREAAAAPRLLKVCRRHAGFDRARAVPEVAAALKALAAMGAAEPARAILRLVTQDALGPLSVAAALDYFAALRHRPAAALLDLCFGDESLAVREAACALAAAIGQHGCTETLLELRTDREPRVADAALIALGNLGYRPVKEALEARLRTARPAEIPKVVESLAGVADAETAVTLGRAAEGTSDDTARRAIAQALAELSGRAATNRLLRLAGDPCPGVRRAVAAGLAETGDPRREAALRRLADDPDPQVAEAAALALRGHARVAARA